jgi:hypothetical protein
MLDRAGLDALKAATLAKKKTAEEEQKALDATLLETLQKRAVKDFDGFLTILRYTKAWRVGFINPTYSPDSQYLLMPPRNPVVDSLCIGPSLEVAAEKAMALSKAEHWESVERCRQEFYANLRRHMGRPARDNEAA